IYGVDHTYGKRSWAPSAARFVFGLIEHIYEPLTTDERSHGGVKRHLIDDLADSCGITLSERQPRLFPSPEMIQRIQFAHGLKEDLAKGRLLIGINGGHTWPVREWDVVKWQSAIDQIHANFDAVILQFGLSLGPGMPDPYNHLKGVRLLANALKLEDLVALIAGCHLVISIDSGPIHVAGAVGTPVVGLFGAVNPLYRLPVASPSVGVVSDVPCLFCHHRTPIEHWKTDCPYGIRCMKLLEVPVVFQAIQELLSKSKKESFGTISPQAD
ncbi:MAG TPA: glycosyltransferase family 9 protein, partial [Candidatus Methylacidiphilales bacterium]